MAEADSRKRARTRARLSACALALFEDQGFERTTVAQIAAVAGVSEMTFFRHFPSKELSVLDDPYDPAIVEAIGAQPGAMPPLRRAVRGMRSAFASMSEPGLDAMRRRVRIVAATPALRAGIRRTNDVTEQLIAERLIGDGAPTLEGRVAAAAVMAALTAALFIWAEDEARTLGTAIAAALDVLDPVP